MTGALVGPLGIAYCCFCIFSVAYWLVCSTNLETTAYFEDPPPIFQI
jgi:hypothetical protein